MASDIVHNDFGAQENKICHCFHCNIDPKPEFSRQAAPAFIPDPQKLRDNKGFL